MTKHTPGDYRDIVQVREVREDEANKLLADGWVLLDTFTKSAYEAEGELYLMYALGKPRPE